MELIKNEEIIYLNDENTLIEKYDLNEEINFKGLVDYLLKKNLSSKVMLEDKVEEKTDSEENLIKLINSIINDYNDKVGELEKFKKENKD
jgi:hypothetical protein